MKSHFVLLLTAVVAIAGSMALGQSPTCTPSTLVAKQKRTDMKHRQPASSGTEVEKTQVDEMLSWDQPDDLQDPDIRSSNSPIHPREESVFQLEGDLWRVAQEANDCDYHLELSSSGKSAKADRIIVEVPQDDGYGVARDAVLQALTPSDRTKLENDGEVLLQTPVHLKLTGYAFFDAFHYSPHFSPAHPGKCNFTKAQKLQRGNGHGTCFVGTLWELHPVWKVTAAQ